jgi:hypothetical protein
MSIADEDIFQHPLFMDSLPSAFENNKHLKALAAVNANEFTDSEDDDQPNDGIPNTTAKSGMIDEVEGNLQHSTNKKSGKQITLSERLVEQRVNRRMNRASTYTPYWSGSSTEASIAKKCASSKTLLNDNHQSSNFNTTHSCVNVSGGLVAKTIRNAFIKPSKRRRDDEDDVDDNEKEEYGKNDMHNGANNQKYSPGHHLNRNKSITECLLSSHTSDVRNAKRSRSDLSENNDETTQPSDLQRIRGVCSISSSNINSPGTKCTPEHQSREHDAKQDCDDDDETRLHTASCATEVVDSKIVKQNRQDLAEMEIFMKLWKPSKS